MIKKLTILVIIFAVTGSFIPKEPLYDHTHYIEPYSWDDLDPEKLYYILRERNVRYPEIFTKIAILESGWNFESDFSVVAHNLFGMGYVSRLDTTIVNNVLKRKRNTTCKHNYFGHSYYYSYSDAITDLENWIWVDPPLPNENPYTWLYRRGFNRVNPVYYDHLRSIDIFKYGKRVT